MAGSGTGATAGGGASGSGSGGTAGMGTGGVGGTTGMGTGGGGGGGGSGGTGGTGTGGARGGSTGAGACAARDIDLPATSISGTVTVRGAAVPEVGGTGNLTLRNVAGDSALLAPTRGAYAQVVLPGTYDLYYELASPGPSVPGNKLTKLRGGIVVGGTPQTIDFDVAATMVSGTITLNGVSAAGKDGRANLRLRNASGDDILLGTTAATGSYSALVIPGTYDLYFIVDSSGTGVPPNTLAKLQAGIVVGSTPLVLNIDVPAATVSGTFTLNGATVPPVNGWGGALQLRNAAGDSAIVATKTGTFTSLLIPGTYDLYYSVLGLSTAIPSNVLAKLQTGVVIGTGAQTLNADVPATVVSGSLTIGGAAVPQTTGVAAMSLRNAAGDQAQLATTSTGTYSQLVVPGIYDLYFGISGAGAGLPGNQSVKLRSAIVVPTSALTLDIDVPVTPVSGTITVNGAQVPQTRGTGNLSLRTAAGDVVGLGTTATVGAYSRLVVPGTYDLFYSAGSDVTGVPANTLAKLRTGIVVGPSALALDIDIAATQVSGTFSQNGVPLPGSTGGSAYVYLQGAGGDGATLGSTAISTYSRYVIPGAYELIYAVNQSASGTPSNRRADLRCFAVP
jgi:hypothetical protein